MPDETTEPIYAHFRHPDGSWYRLWVTRSEPKTGRGHRWHLHANYDKSGTMAPVAGTRWWEQPYGTANWDYDGEPEALAAFRERADQRMSHGYALAEGTVPAPAPAETEPAAQPV
jgi:hypothetical protein